MGQKEKGGVWTALCYPAGVSSYRTHYQYRASSPLEQLAEVNAIEPVKIDLRGHQRGTDQIDLVLCGVAEDRLSVFAPFDRGGKVNITDRGCADHAI